MTPLARLVDRAAVIDPATSGLALRMVHRRQATLVPLDRARQMVADATRTRFVNGHLTIEVDGGTYEFPEVVA